MLILTCLYMSSSNEVRDNYINTYKEVAIVEMHRRGIPASIKLAQAILESQSGTSSFSLQSNNHFGIKCKHYWKGQKFYHKDDDLDDTGKLISSCFRSYDRVLESYVDHSNFLFDSGNYTALFLLPIEDYRQWARGLQKYGYATDPKYAQKLISIIERESLWKYDSM